MRKRAAAAAAVLFFAAPACATPVVLAVGSDLAAYQQALAGAQEAVPGAAVVDVRKGAPELPADARVVVAIGTRAALERYPAGVEVVYCMAPGLPTPEDRAGRWARADMSPPPGQLLVRARRLQPGLRRLGVLWGSPWFEGYVAELALQARAAGVSLQAVRVSSPDEVPSALRSLKGRVDALWTPLDPRVLSPVTLSALKSFCEGSGIAYYAPAPSLIRYAAASISGTFRGVGRAAGEAARAAAAGAPLKAQYLPSRVLVVANKTEAAAMDLPLTPQALGSADRTLP